MNETCPCGCKNIAGIQCNTCQIYYSWNCTRCLPFTSQRTCYICFHEILPHGNRGAPWKRCCRKAQCSCGCGEQATKKCAGCSRGFHPMCRFAMNTHSRCYGCLFEIYPIRSLFWDHNLRKFGSCCRKDSIIYQILPSMRLFIMDYENKKQKL